MPAQMPLQLFKKLSKLIIRMIGHKIIYQKNLLRGLYQQWRSNKKTGRKKQRFMRLTAVRRWQSLLVKILLNCTFLMLIAPEYNTQTLLSVVIYGMHP